MKRIKCRILLVLLCLTEIVAVNVIGILQPYAEENYTAADGNQVDEQDLNDNIVEYREIGSLVHYNNSSVQVARANLQRTKSNYTELKNQLVWEKADAVSDKKEAQDSKDISSYVEDLTNEKIYSSAITAYNTMIDKFDTSYTANASWKTVEKQITNAAQSLMISYQSLSLEEETLTQLKDLYSQIATDTLVRQQAGLATEAEVLKAQNQLSSSEISLESILNGKDSIRSNLYNLLGLELEKTYEFQKIPIFDRSVLDTVNLEQDTKTAIGNNQTIVATRHTKTDGSSAADQFKALEENGQSNELTVKMNNLFGNVETAEDDLDAASTGLSAAELSFNSAEVKLNAGLSGKSEFLQSKLNYIQKKSGYETADLNLFQTYETYEWAVKGITELE